MRAASVGTILIASALGTLAFAQAPTDDGRVASPAAESSSPPAGAAPPAGAVGEGIPSASPSAATTPAPRPASANPPANPAAPAPASVAPGSVAPVPQPIAAPSPTPRPVATPPADSRFGTPRSIADARSATPSPADPTRVIDGTGQLPRTHGQIWRTYDLSPYVDAVQNATKPEQAVLDWILRETGTDVWFGQPFGLMSLDRKALHVYHTPEMHQTVKTIVDRFNQSRGDAYLVHIRVLTVGSPNWRSRAFAMLQPVPVQTPGVEAWLLTKENAALLAAELGRRLDVTEYESSTVSVVNGQTFATERRSPRTYVQTIAPAPGTTAGYSAVQGTIEQGYQLQISPLISEGDRIVDAVVRCRVDQIEKLVDVPLDVPMPGGRTQRIDVQVPQFSSSQLHERFRWPADAVLLISGGLGAVPGAEAGKNVLGLPGGLLEPAPARADGLTFLEIRGRAADAAVAEPTKTAERWGVSGGRY